jgi:hypothetical protein
MRTRLAPSNAQWTAELSQAAHHLRLTAVSARPAILSRSRPRMRLGIPTQAPPHIPGLLNFLRTPSSPLTLRIPPILPPHLFLLSAMSLHALLNAIWIMPHGLPAPRQLLTTDLVNGYQFPPLMLHQHVMGIPKFGPEVR